MNFKVDGNITLALTAQNHAQGLFDAVDQNREHLGAFLPWVSQMQSVENFKPYIANCQRLYAIGEEVSFVILQNEILIGRIGIHHINRHNQYGEIGYWLVQSATGKGIITKSCRVLIAFAFEELRLHRIVIKAAIDNLRSRNIPEQLGFVCEGILRQAEKVNDAFFDIAVYSLLYHEWKNPVCK